MLKRLKHWVKRVKHVWKWLPVLWKDYDYDYAYLLKVMSFKLECMANELESNNLFEGAEKTVGNIRECKESLKVVAAPYSLCEGNWEKFEKRWACKDTFNLSKEDKARYYEEIAAVFAKENKLRDKALKSFCKSFEKNLLTWWD